ncbi:biotin--[acetyl-CoA-carboxylase] ligase [uncultured Dysgonomonas sp.]|uniref:Biotin-(Acetyl-CoA-carboxylase) ligase n=1 Tax=uncultured Dysgonomonas sp. TaxID=206096 RepID=A0A212K0F7_9BACT|nr:biotin--[acetyl-CoA-carboxylase] ligase [uncultured Dysgonomonas sp.]SBW04995.1 Biotin-(acetyl-CoA-carboxylase) ligase [uncultured Dysgonomonas sp.]
MPLIIHLVDEIDSTNNYMKSLLLKQKVKEGTIISADFQTGGRGQRGNGWMSENGKNLLFSIVLYPDAVKANEQFLISQVVSLAVADFLRKYADGITIKWPNDIYWREKKICGILIENAIEGDEIKESVCGIGVNLNQESFDSSLPNPVSLKQITGEYYEQSIMLEEVRELLFSYYEKLRRGEMQIIAEEYRDSLFRKTGYHLFNDNTNDFIARIKNVASDGTLILQTESGDERRFAFKEVRYVL